MPPRLRLAAATSVLLASAVLAGQVPPTFKTEVEYVEVDALVTDERGRPVRGLQKDDFQIFEDGKPQKIAAFSMVDIPAPRTNPTMVGVHEVEPDVQSTQRSVTGRVYVLILDDLHTAPLRSQIVRRAARQFIERYLAPEDVMAVVHANGSSGASQDFTSSRRLLLESIDRFMGQKLESATLARNTEFSRGATAERAGDPLEMERGFNARSTLRTLRQVADWLGGVRGRRKTVVFISEGIDYDISDVFANRSASSIIEDMRAAVAAATHSNVSIYAIDARSLIGIAADAIEVAMFADQNPGPLRDDDGNVQRPPGINSGALRNELRVSQDSLRAIADQTNGFAAVTSSDFASAFERIVSDNSAYYVLAYYPPSTRRDGRFHRIDVRATRPGLSVRARRGYVAPKGNSGALRVADNDGASPEVLEALNSPLPSDGVGLRVFAAPFKGTAADASVVLGIELRGRDLKLTQNERLELSYAAVDASGRVRAGDTESLTLALAPDVRAQVERNGIRILNRLDLPAGRYQVRVAARHSASGAIGALHYDLEVPDFTDSTVSLSGLLLSSTTGAAIMTARGDAQLMKVMPAPPVSLRAFPRSDEVLVFAEVYEQPGRPPHSVDVTTTVRSADGALRFQSAEERSSAESRGANRGYVYTARVPMDSFEPGRYILTVEARSRLGDVASRRVPFDVTR
jgi:VWFA-related protein